MAPREIALANLTGFPPAKGRAGVALIEPLG
jgi:hypothetical protein